MAPARKGHVISQLEYDRQLFDRALAGDARAREEIFVRAFATMQPWVARRLGRANPDTGDVATDAWLRFQRKWRTWSRNVVWERFAYGFARNALRDHWRRLENLREDPLFDDRRSGDDLESSCALREFAVELERLVPGLPPRQREVFELHCDGWSGPQIASQLDLAPATVRVTLRNAKRSLLNQLRERGFDWPPPAPRLEV